MAAQESAPTTVGAIAAQTAWNELRDFINEWFYKPDLDAYRICLAAACSHSFIESDPIWLFNIGAPGCGKTSLGINSLLKFPNSYVMGDLTERTLISGFKTNPGLLHQIGPSGILLFKDFTTMLSKRPDVRAEVTAQLREVYDGCFQRVTGAKAMVAPWTGKITIIAAVTPAIENQWAVMRELGERFIHVWWPRGDGVERAEMSHKQRGKEKYITRTLQEKVMGLVQLHTMAPPLPLPSVFSKRIDNISEVVAMMRGVVPRMPGNHEIAGAPIIETPTRLCKSLSFVPMMHAAIMRREVTEDDMRLLVRVALDTMPSRRRAILALIPAGSEIGRMELITLSKMPPSTCDYHLDTLEALEILEGRSNGIEKRYRFTAYFSRCLERGGLLPT